LERHWCQSSLPYRPRNARGGRASSQLKCAEFKHVRALVVCQTTHGHRSWSRRTAPLPRDGPWNLTLIGQLGLRPTGHSLVQLVEGRFPGCKRRGMMVKRSGSNRLAGWVPLRNRLSEQTNPVLQDALPSEGEGEVDFSLSEIDGLRSNSARLSDWVCATILPGILMICFGRARVSEATLVLKWDFKDNRAAW